MRYPIYPDKHQLPALYTPQELIRYRKQIGRMPELESPEGILFCLERSLPHRLRWRIGVKRAGGMNGDLFTLRRPAGKVGIMTGFGGGSPMTIELAEEFTAMGARRMILMTWGGMLQPGMQAGDIVIAERAIRDEGASYHYLPPEKYVWAHPGLVNQLENAIRMRGGKPTRGTTWTTDAPFRETAEEVRQYQSEEVKTVEMEAAGLFTVGKVRGVATAAVVIGMDSLADHRWHAPNHLDDIMGALELVYAAALDVLKQSYKV